MSTFNPDEMRTIEYVSRHYQSDVDLDEVSRLLESEVFSCAALQSAIHQDSSIIHSVSVEAFAAIGVEMLRRFDEAQLQGREEVYKASFDEWRAILTAQEACTGLEVIKEIGEYWRFKPAAELVFELEGDQLEAAEEFVYEFESTDYNVGVEKHKADMFREYRDWSKSDYSTENIKRGIDIYDDCCSVFERGFPNLLYLKRILDGETPDIDVLQSKKASSVRSELTRDDLNSAYFDFIIQSFERKLRNGLAHGDIIIDPLDEEVRIPSQNARYSYKQINTIVRKNVAVATFLTGTFRSLILWRTITLSQDIDSAPEWVSTE